MDRPRKQAGKFRERASMYRPGDVPCIQVAFDLAKLHHSWYLSVEPCDDA